MIEAIEKKGQYIGGEMAHLPLQIVLYFNEGAV